jgi:photosystem II stability/assembly factor-like uncharacterized protein
VLVMVLGVAIIGATVISVVPRPIAKPAPQVKATAAPPVRSVGLLSAAISNYSTAWLVTGGADVATRLWKTADSGVTWTSVALPVGAAAIISAQIIDPNRAYLVALGGGPVLAVTDDGGRHWRRYPLPSPPGANLAAVTFTRFGEGKALFTGNGSGGIQSAYLYATDDGISWQPRVAVDIDHPAAAGLSLDGRKDAIAFADAEHGIIASGAEGVYLTADGGFSWSFHPLVKPPGEPVLGPTVTAAAVPGAYLVGTAYRALGTPASGTPGAAFVYRSDDGGDTWSDPIPAPTDDGTLTPVFAGSNAWWIAGARTVSESDGHGAWNAGSPALPGASRVMSVFPFDDRRAWAFAGGPSGPPQFLFATTDGGSTWSALKPPA